VPVPRVVLDHVAPIRISVGEAVDALLAFLPEAGRVTFRRLTDGIVDRMEVIVRFLAVLELFKQGLVDLDQAVTFGDLEVCWVAAGERATFAGVDSYDG
jgi:segregation and condensation protein A